MAAMGTLYVVGGPATGPGDLTIRARRILGSVPLVVAGDVEEASLFLARCGISTAVAPASGHDLALQTLAGGDVAVLLPGRSPSPGPEEHELVRAVLASGFAVVPVPGPVVLLTALVLSNLPADSFVYLGSLPPGPGSRSALLESMSAEERTLVLLAGAGELDDLLRLVHRSWGDRSLALWPASATAAQDAWRGSLTEALGAGEVLAPGQEWVLVVAGASQERGLPWDEDRLVAEIRARLARGMGVGQISRELAGASGWPRRRVYRLAVRESA
jgi:16S rRNA (cytidine1402-2'-O)-methyltransferase